MIRARKINGGFTLIEVILAVMIAAGLLFVAISYYQKAADLRSQLIEETERLTTIRLVMDRMSADLRTAITEPRQGFTGTTDFMKFVHAGAPLPGNLAEGALKLVTYAAVTNAQGTNTTIVGFNRVESPLFEMRIAAPTNREPLSFNGAMDPMATVTNEVVEPLTRAIRMVQFRYFDGSEWVETWNGSDLPMGVEVTFGTQAPSENEEEEYAGDLYRRVIYVPAGRAAEYWEGLP